MKKDFSTSAAEAEAEKCYLDMLSKTIIPLIVKKIFYFFELLSVVIFAE